MFLEALEQDDQAQKGDPRKRVEIVIDVVKRGGVAKGKETPLRLLRGNDCFEGGEEEVLGDAGDA